MSDSGPDILGLRSDRSELREPLARWLADRLGASSVDVGPLEVPSGGYSAETLLFDAAIDRGAGSTVERFVVRRELPEPPVYPQQAPGELDVEVDIQYRVMSAVANHSDAPIAPLIGYEADDTVLGGPFFVMGFVDGDIPREDPIYTSAGFFFDARPEQRRQLVDRGLRTMAQIHAIDWQAAGLHWLVATGDHPSTDTQVRIWRDYSDRELDGRDHPVLEAGFAYLYENMPSDDGLCLNWGDGRPGNIIWQDFEPACVTDFEAACISSPLVDLGWWLMFDRWSHEHMGHLPRLKGEPTRAEQRDLYAAHAGHDPGDTTWYEVFAAARYTAIVVRVMNRTVLRGEMPADNPFWLENPSTDCLRALLDEL